MENYTALIVNTKTKKYITMTFMSFSIDGLRQRVEEFYLSENEVLVSLFPTNRMEKSKCQ